MKNWFSLPRRATEALADQVITTGSGLASTGRDPIDNDTGYRAAGRRGSREVPYWTREKARDYSVTAYRANPMATAVVDTYVAFCVGDSGVKWQALNPQVADVCREFWDDPANNVGGIQEIELRSQLILGEKCYELMEGKQSGVVRFAPFEPAIIKDVTLRHNNANWPDKLIIPGALDGSEDRPLSVVRISDETDLREGDALFWRPWRTLDTDVRGMPFLMPILDWLDNYDQVLSNLIDRTSLMRHIAYSVKLTGAGQTEVDTFIANRGGTHMPQSGTIEVHNETVEWTPISGQTGAAEDTQANAAVLTNVASGAGLAKHWLADPEDANRATSLTMAEPVRRRVASVQNVWLCQQRERLQFAVDRAVAKGRLRPMVAAKDPRTGHVTKIKASDAVIVTGPEIAAADAQITAQVLLNLSTGLEKLKGIGALPDEAVSMAARKAWEDFMGIPFSAELSRPGASADDVATYVDESARRLKVVGRAGS